MQNAGISRSLSMMNVSSVWGSCKGIPTCLHFQLPEIIALKISGSAWNRELGGTWASWSAFTIWRVFLLDTDSTQEDHWSIDPSTVPFVSINQSINQSISQISPSIHTYIHPSIHASKHLTIQLPKKKSVVICPHPIIRCHTPSPSRYFPFPRDKEPRIVGTVWKSQSEANLSRAGVSKKKPRYEEWSFTNESLTCWHHRGGFQTNLLEWGLERKKLLGYLNSGGMAVWRHVF